MVTENNNGVTMEDTPIRYPGILRLALGGLLAHRRGDEVDAQHVQDYLQQVADNNSAVTYLTTLFDPKCCWTE